MQDKIKIEIQNENEEINKIAKKKNKYHKKKNKGGNSKKKEKTLWQIKLNKKKKTKDV